MHVLSKINDLNPVYWLLIDALATPSHSYVQYAQVTQDSFGFFMQVRCEKLQKFWAHADVLLAYEKSI